MELELRHLVGTQYYYDNIKTSLLINYMFLLAEEFMTLNNASLFQLTQNSQLIITVSAHACVPIYLSYIMCVHVHTNIHANVCIHMICLCMYVFYVHNIRMKLQFPLTTQ